MTRQVIQSLSYLISHCTNAYRSDNDSDKNNDEDGDEDDANHANADGERGDALLDDDSTS